MLEKVIFKNFRSFAEKTVIDLAPSRIEYLGDTNIYNGVLKGCAFYGGNASGKTNALLAITLLLDLLFKDGTTFQNEFYSLFSKEKKASFEYFFRIDGSSIVYFFEWNKEKGVTKETLKQDDNVFLDRTLTSAKSYITENEDYDGIDPNALFIRSIYFNTRFNGFPKLGQWFDYLKQSVYFNPVRAFAQLVTFDPKNDKNIFLQNYLEQKGTDEINDFLSSFSFPMRIQYTSAKNNPVLAVYPFQTRLLVAREGMASVPFYMESVGTQMLLSFLPSFLTVTKTGGILAIDEFSSGLHNDLEEMLVRYFYSKAGHAQLFFVSHSTNLLKTSLIRPDQVYSVDFNKTGSFLVKFSEYGMREGQNMEKMYLSGAFGGIPLYEEPGH